MENLSFYTISNFSNYSIRTRERPAVFDSSGEVRIPLYVLIFILSVLGNGLVILTLGVNRRMRTVTNVFLLNLSVSDLLLSAFCMPFTLIPQLLRNFIFGEVMCVLIRYLQAVSVCVSCYTLVAISLERFFAICYPLRSRRWQTLSHAYKSIAGIWIFAVILMIPIAASQKLFTLRNGNQACREIWEKNLRSIEVGYSLTLAVVLLVIPLVVMGAAYGRISFRLWFTIRQQIQGKQGSQEKFLPATSELGKFSRSISGNSTVCLRQNNQRSINSNRKRVIKMLFVVVLEYFCCWTPLYVLNTWKILNYRDLRGRISDMTWSMILLISYTSSFLHPITYCFMNKNFRKAFVDVFKCFSFSSKRLIRSSTEVSHLNSITSHTLRQSSQTERVSMKFID